MSLHGEPQVNALEIPNESTGLAVDGYGWFGEVPIWKYPNEDCMKAFGRDALPFTTGILDSWPGTASFTGISNTVTGCGNGERMYRFPDDGPTRK